MGSGEYKNYRTNFFSLSYIAKCYIRKNGIVKLLKPCKIGQSSVKSFCSSTPSSVTNTWLFDIWGKWKAFNKEHELMNITLICKRNATYLAAGPWTGSYYKNG